MIMRPPSFSRASTPIECDAGMASILRGRARDDDLVLRQRDVPSGSIENEDLENVLAGLGQRHLEVSAVPELDSS